MKICSKCKAEKPLTEFHKNSSADDGLKSKCKECIRDISKKDAEKRAVRQRKHYLANIERIAARQSEYGKANLEKNAARAREFRKNNHAKYAERRDAYRKANAESIAERKREYIKANPEKHAAQKRNRRAIKRAAEGIHTSTDVLAIISAQRWMCASCQTKLIKSGPKKYHVDHIMPLALGGSNWPENLQCLCPACNLSKGAKHPDVWAKQQGKLL